MNLIHYDTQFEYIIGKTLVFPFGADVSVCVGFAFICGRCIPNQFVQQTQFVEHLASNHISITIFCCHNHTSESTYTRNRDGKEKQFVSKTKLICKIETDKSNNLVNMCRCTRVPTSR